LDVELSVPDFVILNALEVAKINVVQIALQLMLPSVLEEMEKMEPQEQQPQTLLAPLHAIIIVELLVIQTVMEMLAKLLVGKIALVDLLQGVEVRVRKHVIVLVGKNVARLAEKGAILDVMLGVVVVLLARDSAKAPAKLLAKMPAPDVIQDVQMDAMAATISVIQAVVQDAMINVKMVVRTLAKMLAAALHVRQPVGQLVLDLLDQ
jgi:hypothetical protein